MRICVIGAGIAGLACALAAAGVGQRVDVFEAAARLPGLPVHVDIVPNMLRDLAALGVADECVRAGFAYRDVDVVDRYGRPLHVLRTPSLAGPRLPAALGICHDQLNAVLERAVGDRGVAVRTGARVLAVHEHGERALVRLEHGQSVEADLVILAAGHSSDLRSSLFPWASPAIVLPQAWWYALVARPLGLDRPLIAHGVPGHRAVLVPVSHDRAGLVLTVPLSACAEHMPDRHVRDVLSMFAPRMQSVADHLEGVTVVRRPARCAMLELPWHQGAVLAVGDSAHALPPHSGQAAAQAVEDARVLSELLANASDRGSMLRDFQQRRAARVRQVYDITTAAARWDLNPDADADQASLMEQLTQIVVQPA
jgi:2-polyprenyl-6-methoxyphenol hydroxylase-like FAD-dependent oxidoreductase